MKRGIVSIVIMFVLCNAYSQSTDDFNTFRQNMMTDYQNFRKTILDNYATYLDGVWKEFQQFKGITREDIPKPKTAPIAKDIDVKPIFVPAPDPIVMSKSPYLRSVKLPVVSPAIPNIQPVKVPDILVENNVLFSFYGIPFEAPVTEEMHVSMDNSSVANAWREYQKGNAKLTVSTLNRLSGAIGLNDYLKFELVNCYVNELLKNNNVSDRIVLSHYILSNMGFDIRLGKTKNQYLLLVPFNETIFSKSYITLENKKYYIFTDRENTLPAVHEPIYTCDIPSNCDTGKAIEATFNSNIQISSGNIKHCVLTDNVITITGDVNVSLMEMLRHYPQMDISAYASSRILPSLRKDVLHQVENQLIGLSQGDAANKLIHFVQYAFEYATDGDQHGYEKAYFFEENFYYPKNDCEDRAIFFAYLVRNLLELDVHLVQFPGHECAAVNFTDSSISGDSYMYQGKRYIICDPTYIGACIGRCMPDYKDIKPIVQVWH